MSVKFQEKLQEEAAGSMRHETKELAHKIGDRLTGGKTQAGYLAVSALASTSPTGELIAGLVLKDSKMSLLTRE